MKIMIYDGKCVCTKSSGDKGNVVNTYPLFTLLFYAS
jgi:hypothetical protein